jgi:hypothetical protein
MSFDNSTMKPPRIFKPHIQLIGGYWRISKWQGWPAFNHLPSHIINKWSDTHSVVNQWNAAREFGMVTPNATK